MGFSRQEYWGGLPFPSPGDLPDPGLLGVCRQTLYGLSHWGSIVKLQEDRPLIQPDWCLYKRNERYTEGEHHVETDTEDSHVKTEAETGMRPGKNKEGTLLRRFGEHGP